MRIVFFVHSLTSDWNHGNAHFLRGLATELIVRGHEVLAYEPCDSWSRNNLTSIYGNEPLTQFYEYYPYLRSIIYNKKNINFDTTLDSADLVIVHEWNDPEIVKKIGTHRKQNAHYRLLFHDTHHRSVSAPHEMANYDLSGYDGVLAFGEIIRDIYLKNSWTDKSWTFHEAADIRIFNPVTSAGKKGDIVWIGNWGDEERTSEIFDYLIDPVGEMQLKASIYGVRYPDEAQRELDKRGIRYCGWLPNYKVPQVFADYRLTVHIPRGPYVKMLPGIPTIRPFEALACGIPLISSPWTDSENMFTEGKDYLVAKDKSEMKSHIRDILNDKSIAQLLSVNGRRAILERHTCAHRAEQLTKISKEIGCLNITPQAGINQRSREVL